MDVDIWPVWPLLTRPEGGVGCFGQFNVKYKKTDSKLFLFSSLNR